VHWWDQDTRLPPANAWWLACVNLIWTTNYKL